MSDSKKSELPSKTAPAELDDTALDKAAGGVDPTNPNVVYVGGSTRFGTWDKMQELRSGK